MTAAQSEEPTRRKPLRLWPGVVIVIVQWLLWFVVPFIEPEAGLIAVAGGVGGGLAIVLWWVFFSRARWSDRLGVIVLMIVAVVATRPILHKSIQNGMMGMMFVIYVIPGLSLALVAGEVAGHRLSGEARRAVTVAAILLACGVWTLLRTDGISGRGAQLAWRWTPNSEERLLGRGADYPTGPPPAPAAANTPTELPVAKASDAPAALPATPPTSAAKNKPATLAAVKTAAEWPGFRGPGRDSIVRGVRIETDWSKSPPVALWRRPIGPGWSSFAVGAGLLYTQEQRGDDEIVGCHKVSTGEPVWQHRDAARFWESNAGAGPRATPTLSGGRVYTFGATGILNALEAGNGAVVWSRNVASDTGRRVPDWGFASSPLVVDDLVIVAASGTLAAYDLATGKPRWIGPRQLGSYSSPHRATIAGVAQVLLLSGSGAAGFAPANGAVLWEHGWQAGGTTIVQPALMADGDILINAIAMTGGAGLRRIAVAHKPDGWSVEERWTSNGLKPYFNDFVVHKGHAFGFDGSILACIDLEDGKRKWKGGRYGNGQLVLLPDQDLLLVLSEEGELALVGATPDQFKEIARFRALDGKTWNHPVVVGDILLVRNGEEMAAFRLSLAGVGSGSKSM
jgi:outer membrane protein assembly factor BamB